MYNNKNIYSVLERSEQDGNFKFENEQAKMDEKYWTGK